MQTIIYKNGVKIYPDAKGGAGCVFCFFAGARTLSVGKGRQPQREKQKERGRACLAAGRAAPLTVIRRIERGWRLACRVLICCLCANLLPFVLIAALRALIGLLVGWRTVGRRLARFGTSIACLSSRPPFCSFSCLHLAFVRLFARFASSAFPLAPHFRSPFCSRFVSFVFPLVLRFVAVLARENGVIRRFA